MNIEKQYRQKKSLQVTQELGRREAGMFQMRLLGLVHDHHEQKIDEIIKLIDK